ncbi:hypothetical protein C8Q77DRAFT_3517 [Trametes polyzona]|nr:hypothetical protein C8Q77DRAFT_3517 [Trametes polyzona]
MSHSLGIMYIATSTLAHVLAILVTWHKTREARHKVQGALRRPSLAQITWEYGLAYFMSACSSVDACEHILMRYVSSSVLLGLIIVDAITAALSLSILGEDNGSTYLDFFILPLASILTTRFMLDLFETDARLQHGGVLHTGGSFSLDLDLADTPTAGTGSLEFVTAYGGPTRVSFLGFDEPLDGAVVTNDDDPALQLDCEATGHLASETEAVGVAVVAPVSEPGDNRALALAT